MNKNKKNNFCQSNEFTNILKNLNKIKKNILHSYNEGKKYKKSLENIKNQIYIDKIDEFNNEYNIVINGLKEEKENLKNIIEIENFLNKTCKK